MLCFYCNNHEAEHRFLVEHNDQVIEVYACKDCVERLWRYTENVSRVLKNALMGGAGADRALADIRENGPFPPDAGDDVKKKRRLAELRAQLRDAVEREAYEDAAKIRDQITKCEQGVYL